MSLRARLPCRTWGRVLAVLPLLLSIGAADAQQAGGKKRPPGRPSPTQPQARPPQIIPAPAGLEEGREFVQADVSTRTVGITAGFSGSQVVVFGSIENSKQKHAENGVYDIVIVLVGPNSNIVTRKKSRVAGIWINTQSVTFAKMPSYYAIASTRPIDEIAEAAVLAQHEIGFEHVGMQLGDPSAPDLTVKELVEFRDAAVRLKTRESLYRKDDFGVSFAGRSLFRAQVMLPANVPVGPLDANVYLFRDGEFLSKYLAHLNLEREGLEQWVYASAYGYPLLYGVASVVLAVLLGLGASTLMDTMRRP